MTTNENKLIDDLLLIESGLTWWEVDFIEILDQQRSYKLTPRQSDKLHAIARKVDLES